MREYFLYKSRFVGFVYTTLAFAFGKLTCSWLSISVTSSRFVKTPPRVIWFSVQVFSHNAQVFSRPEQIDPGYTPNEKHRARTFFGCYFPGFSNRSAHRFRKKKINEYRFPGQHAGSRLLSPAAKLIASRFWRKIYSWLRGLDWPSRNYIFFIFLRWSQWAMSVSKQWLLRIRTKPHQTCNLAETAKKTQDQSWRRIWQIETVFATCTCHLLPALATESEVLLNFCLLSKHLDEKGGIIAGLLLSLLDNICRKVSCPSDCKKKKMPRKELYTARKWQNTPLSSFIMEYISVAVDVYDDCGATRGGIGSTGPRRSVQSFMWKWWIVDFAIFNVPAAS